MRHLFQKGQARPANAGRRKGIPNKVTATVSEFCQGIIESHDFQAKWRTYFLLTPIAKIDPRLLALLFAYAYGRPKEHTQLDLDLRAQTETQVIFYIPDNGRSATHRIEHV